MHCVTAIKHVHGVAVLQPGKPKADLDLYLSHLTARKRTAVETWLRLKPTVT